jgi:HAD superfamily hydrolase (TIGR01549 family)
MIGSSQPKQADIRRNITAALRGIIFDVDGTLYQQSQVRRALLRRFFGAYLKRPLQALSTLRAVQTYRKAHEALRRLPPDWSDIAEAQLQLACNWAHVSPEFMRTCVARWMEQETLDLIAASARDGLSELLLRAKELGLRLGVFSDYPAKQKLAAMQIDQFFDVVVTAQDPGVQRFKPDPRGLQVALQRLGVHAEESLYIGDETEVDGAAAQHAGMRCIILGQPRMASDNAQMAFINGYREISELFFAR